MRYQMNPLTPSEQEALSKAGISQEFYSRSVQASMEYFRLMNSFSRDLKGTSYEFPDHYGGAYIDDDGYLTINVSGEVDSSRRDFVLRIDDSDVKYKQVRWSLAKLNQIRDLIYGLVTEQREDRLGDMINAWSVDERNNQVIVYVRELDEKTISHINEAVPYPGIIKVEQSAGNFMSGADQSSDGVVLSGNTLMPGEKVINPSTGTFGSIGFFAWYISAVRRGLVTAGHLITVGEKIRNSSNVTYGECALKKFGGNVDAAFCDISDSSFEMSDLIDSSGGDTIGNQMLTPPTGSVVFKSGCVTGVTSGKVLSTDYNFSYNEYPDVKFTGFVTADYEANHGDSGGLVYAKSNYGGSAVICGIQSGIHGDNYAFFCKALNIIKELNIDVFQ